MGQLGSGTGVVEGRGGYQFPSSLSSNNLRTTEVVLPIPSSNQARYLCSSHSPDGIPLRIRYPVQMEQEGGTTGESAGDFAESAIITKY